MEWFFAFVGLMVIIAIIRLRNRTKSSSGHPMGSSVNQPVHFWMGTNFENSDGGGGLDSGSAESGGGSFDGGSSDGGGGDSSGF